MAWRGPPRMTFAFLWGLGGGGGGAARGFLSILGLTRPEAARGGVRSRAGFCCFPRINAAGGRRGAALMSRLQAALYFFCFPLAAPRVARVLASPRRVRNRRAGLVGFGFERSLVSAVTCFWPDSGYYSTPSRPQCFKLIQLAAAAQNNESRLAGADPVSSQLDAYPTKTAAKSPFRPVSDGWRPLGRLCSLASMSYTTLAASAAGRYEQTQLTREPTILGRSPTHQSVAVERANARKSGRQASWTRESIFIFLLPGEL